MFKLIGKKIYTILCSIWTYDLYIHLDIYVILYILKTPKLVLLQTMKTQMKGCIMRHFIRVYTVCKGKKRSSDKKKQYIFLDYNLKPPDRYNGLCQNLQSGVRFVNVT